MPYTKKSVKIMKLIVQLILWIMGVAFLFFAVDEPDMAIIFIIIAVLCMSGAYFMYRQQRNLNALLKLNPIFPYYEHALQVTSEGKYKKAIPLFEKILADFSYGHDLAYTGLTEAYLQLDDEAKGMHYFQKGYDSNSTCRLMVLGTLAEYYERKGDHHEQDIRKELEELRELAEKSDKEASKISLEDTLYPVPKPGPSPIIEYLSEMKDIAQIYVVEKKSSYLPDRITYRIVLISDDDTIFTQSERNAVHTNFSERINTIFPWGELDYCVYFSTYFTKSPKDQEMIQKIRDVAGEPYLDHQKNKAGK